MVRFALYAACSVLLGGCLGTNSGGETGPEPLADEPFSIAGVTFPNEAATTRSRFAEDSTGRLARFLGKCRKRREIRVGFIGGSITQGVIPERFSLLLSRFLRKDHPNLRLVQEINVGVSATGSRFAVSRVQEQLLSQDPDLVVVEFAVNDAGVGPEEYIRGTLEGLIRQLLSHDPDLAVILLFTSTRYGGNIQDLQGEIGRHYGLPMVSYRDAMWPFIESEQIPWDSLFLDDPHPSLAGQRMIAQLLHSFLDRAALQPSTGVKAVPSPLVTDVFETAGIVSPVDKVVTVTQAGWSQETRIEDPYSGPWRYAYRTLGRQVPDTLTLQTRARNISIGIHMQPTQPSSVRIVVPGLLDTSLSNFYAFDHTRTVNIFTVPDPAPRTVHVIHQGLEPFTIDFVLYAGVAE